LAKELGLTGHALPVYPNAGGFDLGRLKSIRNRTQTSQRRCVMLKGYQHWCGRALVGLRALALAKEQLKGYEVIVYSAVQEDVRIAAELFNLDTGIPITLLPVDSSHDTILNCHAQSRISIGLSISDAISTSMLEAMVMGSFPIQSNTAATEEWLVHGETGFSVPPEDPDVIAEFLRRALTDDALVDAAADKNWATALERLDYRELKKKTVDSYRFIYEFSEKSTTIEPERPV
jgi:glycosyltransferase involved in cell wall biosynthesis